MPPQLCVRKVRAVSRRGVDAWSRGSGRERTKAGVGWRRRLPACPPGHPAPHHGRSGPCRHSLADGGLHHRQRPLIPNRGLPGPPTRLLRRHPPRSHRTAVWPSLHPGPVPGAHLLHQNCPPPPLHGGPELVPPWLLRTAGALPASPWRRRPARATLRPSPPRPAPPPGRPRAHRHRRHPHLHGPHLRPRRLLASHHRRHPRLRPPPRPAPLHGSHPHPQPADRRVRH